MHNKKLVRKYGFGSSVYNPAASLIPTTPGISLPSVPSPVSTPASTAGQGVNLSGLQGIGAGLATQYLGGMLGNLVGGEAGNAVGAIAGNLGSNILLNGLKGGLSNFSSVGNWANLGGSIVSGMLDRSTAHQRTSGKYGSLASTVDTAAPLINMIGGTSNPYGMVGTVGMSAINRITGGTDGMTVADSLLGSSSVAGALFAANPYVGAAYMALSGLNSATGKTTLKNLGNDFMSKEQLSSLWGSYGKSEADHRDASKYGNKKYGGLSRLTGQFGKANRKVGEDNERINTLLDIYDRQELGKIRGESMADINSLDYRLNTFGGYDLFGTYIGRKGMKLPTKENMVRTRNIISMWGGGKYGKYNTHKTGDKCSTEHCATFSNLTIREQKDLKTGKKYTTYGDAWNLQDVEPVYSGYDESARPGIRTLQGMKMYSYNAADKLRREFNSNTLDKNLIYAVNMFYKNSPNWEKAFKEGKTTTGTHTGYLYHDGKQWLVAHNIHNKIYVDPFLKIQGSGGDYGVTAIFKPIVGKGRKTGLFGWGFLGLKQGGVIDSFKKGGQMSVIPEGALHARLHHMETGDKITKKGIPVVDKSGEQQAEIERNEIIFSLELTNKLEALRKDGSDEAAIKAGKLLVNEIFYNTDDRTGLIQEVVGLELAKSFKEGGILAEKPLCGIEAEKPEINKEEIEFYQRGGKKKALFVKDVYDPSIRTEGDIIYNADTEELKYHEYGGHFNPNQRLLKDLEPYWKDLNDEKLKQFGTDLNFVKRNGEDPGYFFNPQEVLGRVEGSRSQLGNLIWKVDPEFFKNLKETDENKYGDNMRDLLYMYNPEILTEIFKSARKYLKPLFEEGGIIAEKPNMLEFFLKGGKTPELVWKILNDDENFDDGFIDEPEYDDDLRYKSLPESIKNKITEEDWEQFLDYLFSMEELVSEAKLLNPRFILRLLEEPRGIEFVDDNGETVRGSHYLSSGEDEFGGYVYPQILELPDGSLKFFKDPKEAEQMARKNNNILRFDNPMDAFRFSTRYKRFFPEFFQNFK